MVKTMVYNENYQNITNNKKLSCFFGWPEIWQPALGLGGGPDQEKSKNHKIRPARLGRSEPAGPAGL